MARLALVKVARRPSAEAEKLDALSRERRDIWKRIEADAAAVKLVDADIAVIEKRREGVRRARQARAAHARSRFYLDGSPKDTAAHREIAQRYAWHRGAMRRTLKIKPGETGKSKLMTWLRMAELDRLFSTRYGTILPDDDAGRGDLKVMAHHIARLQNPEPKIMAWARLRCPWANQIEVCKVITHVLACPRRWTADKMAWELGLTMAERSSLHITTIGALDSSVEKRKQLDKLRRREHEAAKRRERGAKPRADYEANSAEQLRPWEALGISRRTWYRRGKPSLTRREDNGSVGRMACVTPVRVARVDE
jgi:hypothetical protein